jgi:hypothetical protein
VSTSPTCALVGESRGLKEARCRTKSERYAWCTGFRWRDRAQSGQSSCPFLIVRSSIMFITCMRWRLCGRTRDWLDLITTTRLMTTPSSTLILSRVRSSWSHTLTRQNARPTCVAFVFGSHANNARRNTSADLVRLIIKVKKWLNSNNENCTETSNQGQRKRSGTRTWLKFDVILRIMFYTYHTGIGHFLLLRDANTTYSVVILRHTT